jgi:hypothetical protein
MVEVLVWVVGMWLLLLCLAIVVRWVCDWVRLRGQRPIQQRAVRSGLHPTTLVYDGGGLAGQIRRVDARYVVDVCLPFAADDEGLAMDMLSRVRAAAVDIYFDLVKEEATV